MRLISLCLLSIAIVASTFTPSQFTANNNPLSSTGEGVHSRPQQATPPPNATVLLTDVTGYQSAGVYLGEGLILTSWQTVAGEHLLWDVSTQTAAELRYQLPSFLDDGVRHSWEQAIELTLCKVGSAYQVSTNTESAAIEQVKSENRCIPYNLAQGMTVTRPSKTANIPISHLLYADRGTDIALLEVDHAALTGAFPDLVAAPLDDRPLQRGQTLRSNPLHTYYEFDSLYFVLDVLPSTQIQPQQGTFDGSAQKTRVIPVQPVLPDRLGQARPTLLIGQGYYSTEGGLVGLHWGQSSDGNVMFTPTTAWYNDLWTANETLKNDRLTTVLKDALVPDAVPGLNTIGDSFSSELGNTGYDVLHYNLALTIDPFSRHVQGTTTLQIKAIYHHLASFTLDLRTMAVADVQVNGEPVSFTQYQRKLLIELATPLEYGAIAEVAVTYSGIPLPTDTPYSNFFPVGLEYVEGQPRLAFINQPDGANTWFPCNDHPLDRATYEFHITVPSTLMAIANGIPADPTPLAATQLTYHWTMDVPMATNLAVVAVGDYSLVVDGSVDNLPIRNYAYTGTEDKVETLLSSTDLAFRYLRVLFGQYPFESYGHVVTPLPNGAVETQTMTIMPRSMIQADSEEALFTLVVHELAHQWYGDTVSLKSWRDIWLNEGFATYAEWLALELRYGPNRAARVRSNQERAIRGSQRETPLAYPLTGQMYDSDNYVKGAWILHMLREELGNTVFFEVLHRWAIEYADYPVTTWDFFRLTEQISGRDLTQFRRQWVESPGIPEYKLVWTYGKRGLEVAACNQRDVSYKLRLPVEVQGSGLNGATVTTTVYVELGSAAVQTFPVSWTPSTITVDAQQQVLENITTFYTEGQASCLLSTP
ncbi:MAG: M1 family metallopeptidase [Chloroflexi bacterium]|nr:M1 family metallopeptidase [Chloroflexota bacterium]